MDPIPMPAALLSCPLLFALRGQEECRKQVGIGDAGRWARMKKPIFVFIVTMIALHSLSFGMEQGFLAEKMSLFESAQVIHKFLSGKTKNNYTGKYLTRVSLEFCESHPKKGFAYVYFFNNQGGRMGGELTIHHFIDGEIFEDGVGP